MLWEAYVGSAIDVNIPRWIPVQQLQEENWQHHNCCIMVNTRWWLPGALVLDEDIETVYTCVVMAAGRMTILGSLLSSHAVAYCEETLGGSNGGL